MERNLEHDRLTEQLRYQGSKDRHFERLEFVKHVCDVLIESRYEHATRRRWFVFDDDVEGLFERKPLSDLMPDAAFDLMPGDPFAKVAGGKIPAPVERIHLPTARFRTLKECVRRTFHCQMELPFS